MPGQGEVGYSRRRGGGGGAEAPSRPPCPAASLRRPRLSPSLRCSAASLVSWESEMKHCSSGREKMFCGRRPEAVSAGVGGTRKGTDTSDLQAVIGLC